MKWFHHDTDIRHKEVIAKLKAEFGFEGIGRYWTICEIVAEQMDYTDKCFAEFPESKWLSELVIRRPLFHRYLIVIGQLFDNRVIMNGSLIRIEMPNLLTKKDNHSRNLQAKLKKLASKEIDKEIDKEKDKRLPADSDKSESPVTGNFDHILYFEKAWKAYPRKFGRKASYRNYKSTVKNIDDHARLMSAMANYLRYAHAMQYDYQHGSTWFNNWQDHIEPHVIKPKNDPINHFEKNREVIDDWLEKSKHAIEN